MNKRNVIVVVVLALIVIGGVLVNKFSVTRIQYVGSLFTGATQHQNFGRVKDVFPTSTLNASNSAFQFSEGKKIKLPSSFVFDGESVESDSFVTSTDTAALLVIHEGEVKFEEYYLTGGRKVNWLSMSVAKSFISALVGIAIDEGHIGSVEEPITQYCPSLKGSAYDGVRIKDILQMSSGAAWNEDYSDINSDINQFGKIMALGGSFNEFAATLKTDKTPGTNNHYNSTDTQVLGMLLTNATGRTITDYMQEKLWTPLGMESDAYWMVDDEGMEMAFGGLNATARDYAKLGELYRLNGLWQGKQIVPAAWVADSLTPDSPHLYRGRDEKGQYMGYGYQWWLPAGSDDDFTAIGVYNQFIYVNPKRDLVIVKLSAYRKYGMDQEESSYRERESSEFFREIGKQFPRHD